VAHPFEVRAEITVDASPEVVWQAISSGPHMNSWFIGSSEVEPGQGGVVRTDYGGFIAESTITAWEPGKHFAYRGPEGEDGSVMAFEYFIEGRGGGRTSIRFVHSGFLTGANWETEYDALKRGDPMYLHTLGEYVTHFAGRAAVKNIFVVGPNVADGDAFWSAVYGRLGLDRQAGVGQQVRAQPEGLAAIDGVVDFVSDEFLGIRTGHGILRLIHGYDGTSVAEHHIFDEDVAKQETDEDWQKWLGGVLERA
jgi:uncharacterized protein YndB with AHSA1/START domain